MVVPTTTQLLAIGLSVGGAAYALAIWVQVSKGFVNDLFGLKAGSVNQNNVIRFYVLVSALVLVAGYVFLTNHALNRTLTLNVITTGFAVWIAAMMQYHVLFDSEDNSLPNPINGAATVRSEEH